MTTAIDAAAGIGRANTDLLLRIASAVQETNQRWFDLGSRVASEAAHAPVIDKAYWDEIAVVAAEVRANGANAAQKAVTEWQNAWSEALHDVELPFQDRAFASIFQAWSPARTTEAVKTPAKSKA